VRFLLTSVAAKGGGGITYIGSFLKHAARLKPEWQFVAFLPPIAISQIQPLPANVRLIATEIGYAPWWKRVWWDQVNFRRLVRMEKADVLYSVANFGMVACPVPQILQILNPVYTSRLYQERYLSHSFSDELSFRLRRGLLCQSVRSADIVMTPTAATLAEVRCYMKVPPERALVNPLGVEEPDPAGASTAPSCGPGEPFRLSYVSYYRAHKNLTTLLQALRELQSKGQRPYRLITNLDPDTGDGLWALTSHQDRSLLTDPLIAPAVEMARPSTHAEALALYERSDLFVFPSIVESFGFPLVEAMVRRVPVLASDTAVNREVCGDAAVYFPLFDYKELAAQIERLAADGGLRAALVNAGAERVRTRFSWERHVREILDKASDLVARRGDRWRAPSA
jgi:glycosyltransferase involved in cell wall biosynthesis